MIETTRTTAGYKLYNELAKTMHYDAALDEVRRRIEVRAERKSADTARVWTRQDGGMWVDEGMYRVQIDPTWPEEDVIEEDIPWDDDLAAKLAKGLKWNE